jgi:hypothetical protein
MGTSIVDGTVEEAVVKRKRGALTVYSPLTFRLNDGGSRTIKSAVVSGDVANHLQPGKSGRFYLFTALDLKGVHGARTADGAAYEFPGKNNAIIFIVLIVTNILWIGLRITVDDGVPLLGVALLGLGVVGFFLTRKTQAEAKAQFDRDRGTA